MSVIRYELTIRLKTASPLHSGGIDEVVNRLEEGKDRQTVVRRFARDGRDRPILTGRSVKGALRAACRRYLSGQPDGEGGRRRGRRGTLLAGCTRRRAARPGGRDHRFG